MTELFRHEPGTEGEATVSVDAASRAEDSIPPQLFGKFSEHLGFNIYHGMDAQLLTNPTLGIRWFRPGNRTPDGGYDSVTDPEKLEGRVADFCDERGFPDPEALRSAYADGMAFGWLPTDEDVTPSPELSPSGDRAQRLEVAGGGGFFGWTYLPLHRTRGLEYHLRLRAEATTDLRLSVHAADDGALGEQLASADLAAGTDWTVLEGDLELPSGVDPEGLYAVSLTAPGDANLVVDNVRVYPDDHVNHADPDVVDLLADSDLPLLRWPGGNFVSGYHWRDGIGPVDDRPTEPNPAWDGIEPNLFGTDEFIEFCEAIDCEPTLCVNAGSGTPEEAAAWVEYCNGDPEETELGALRAKHGHPEPYDVTYWEIGNELYGHWQVHWTTPEGYADRYERYREAMLAADPDIEVMACGSVSNPVEGWNEALLERNGADVRSITDHVLAGGLVDAGDSPTELYHGFMGYADQLGDTYRGLREDMAAAGVEDPKLAVTELQLFAHFNEGADVEEEGGLTPENMPANTTISEALYDATIVHELVRLGFVEMLTHSATVNHGGGIQKERERVWPDPCHHGQGMLSTLAGATPVAVEVTCGTFSTETSFREIDPVEDCPNLDAMAAVHDGELLVSLVHRSADTGLIDVTIDGLPDGEATVTTLTASDMGVENTRTDPDRVAPETTTATAEDGELALTLSPFSQVLLRVDR